MPRQGCQFSEGNSGALWDKAEGAREIYLLQLVGRINLPRLALE